MIPVGVFQPSGEAPWNEANDFSLWRGLLREYAEELLGASEDHGSERAPLDYAAWPLARAMTGGLASGAVRAWCLGLGADPLTFAVDLLAVVVIDAPLYDELFGGLVAADAEGRVISPRPFDEPAVTALLRGRPAPGRRPRRCSRWRSPTAAPCWPERLTSRARATRPGAAARRRGWCRRRAPGRPRSYRGTGRRSWLTTPS